MSNIVLEQKLQRVSSMPIDHAVLLSILKDCGYKRPNDKINYMKKEGKLKTLKRGLYVYLSPYTSAIVSKEIIANNLYGPSYISLDYALYYYGLAPETAYEVTSVTTARTKIFNTGFGVFSYRHINKKLYSIGTAIISKDSGNFMIASMEKALCDKILSIKRLNVSSKKDMLNFLELDLRLESDGLKKLDAGIIRKCADITGSKKLKLLSSIVMEGAVEYNRTDAEQARNKNRK